jgi:hypothetical protein
MARIPIRFTTAGERYDGYRPPAILCYRYEHGVVGGSFGAMFHDLDLEDLARALAQLTPEQKMGLALEASKLPNQPGWSYDDELAKRVTALEAELAETRAEVARTSERLHESELAHAEKRAPAPRVPQRGTPERIAKNLVFWFSASEQGGALLKWLYPELERRIVEALKGALKDVLDDTIERVIAELDEAAFIEAQLYIKSITWELP